MSSFTGAHPLADPERQSGLNRALNRCLGLSDHYAVAQQRQFEAMLRLSVDSLRHDVGNGLRFGRSRCLPFLDLGSNIGERDALGLT